MKISLIIIGILAVIFIVTQTLAMSTTKNIEMYPYEVVKKYDGFEIRRYKEAKFSYITMDAKTYKESANKGFRVLAGYIFGGNDKSEKISMTSPVAMNIKDSTTMMFMIPSSYDFKDLPRPNDENIKFKTEPEKYLACISFDGWANDEKINEYSKKLNELLNKNGIQHLNNFSYFGYNPPFKLINRRNEIIVEIKN